MKVGQGTETRRFSRLFSAKLARSAALVEIQADILALQWAHSKSKGVKEMCIFADNVQFLDRLNNPTSASHLLQYALSDFCNLCFCFNFVKVLKVVRNEVPAAHKLAKAQLYPGMLPSTPLGSGAERPIRPFI
ncbi:hypothetical protein RHGRI_034649 [Rhododendron griersonianum]|uniref:RNase H type-1 domain-containing protein n=1 Tax=Rhododendron griersonianum TaxID=479676 RepID=A0AAV6I2B9_9ERIC|nr:hypothetical protein RHGRI_034649 [Rhododendron griersonianum]